MRQSGKMQPKFYNSLTRKVEDFKSIKAGKVKFYACGPTVYDDQTIGNLRTYVLYDTINRVLRDNKYVVDFVMNITDVGHLTSDSDEGEDKLEKGAKRAGKTVWEISDHYIAIFKDDLKLLNIDEPRLARATDFIKQQIAMIQILLDRGYGYQTTQAIYFDVSKNSSYGELTGQKLSEKNVAVRPEVVADKSKHGPHDFALWFFAVGRFAEHEMKWPSPWGEGFPGWHLECSSIIHETLGDPIDIHAGGVDLIGTHHINEMAQTQAAYNHKLANYWIHGEHLLVEGQRMGKSLGNFYTLQDIIMKDYDPLALRLLYLQSHYRSQMNFSHEALAAAQEFLKNLRAWADLKFQPQLGHKQDIDSVYPQALKKIELALNDDLNTSQALAILSGLVNTAQQDGVDTQGLSIFLEQVDKLLGLGLGSRKDISGGSKTLIASRDEARMASNWARADELRKDLLEQSIEVKDTPHGSVWSRKS